MDEMGSTEFRKGYATITEPTRVTVLGRTVGYWVPSTDYALDQIEGLRRAFLDAAIRGHVPMAEVDPRLDNLAAQKRAIAARGEPVVLPDGISFGTGAKPVHVAPLRSFTPAPKPGKKG